jgi:two-component system nitrogen regulation sensor histidine kinase GlnL
MNAPRLGTGPLARILPPFRSGRDTDPRFQHVLEQLPGAAFLVVNRTGPLLAVNNRATMLTEWTREELMARSLVELVAPGLSNTALDPLYNIEPGRVINLNAIPLRTRSGRVSHVDFRLSALDEGGETLILVVATPVEERLMQEREAAQQARALEAIDQLLTLFASPAEGALELAVQLIREMLAADAVALYRLSELSELSLRHADGAPSGLPHALGPSEAQFLKTPFLWNAGQRADTLLAQSARAAGWTYLFAHPVGIAPSIQGVLVAVYRASQPPATQASTLVGFAAQLIQQLMAQIVRERRLANAQGLALRLSHRLAVLQAEVEDGVVSLSRQGAIDEMNGAAAQILGYRAEDVIGLPFADVLISNDGLADAIRARLSGGGLATLEGILHRRSGEPFPVRARVQPLPLPEGGCVVVLRDLSEAHAHQVRQEHLDQLTYAGQATQSFAHEVRGPLNNIAVGVQYLAARLPGDETLQQAMNKILAECNRLSALMRDLLAWAKPIEPKLEATDLPALLKRLLNRWANKILQHNIRLNFDAPAVCPPVMVDPRLIEQAFVNLIDNALQAMPAGGHLSINLRTADRGPQDRVVEVRVSDSGPGIPDEVRRRIFDPYFTTKPDGTGLGLAICKRLVTINHGAINMDSFSGAGTIFTVTLPAHPSPAEMEQTP